MIKHYFKYGAGYINLDPENLYLTSSGNWQEARELGEKGKATIASNNDRIARMKGFVYSIFAIIASTIFMMFEKKTISIGIIAGLAVLAYYLLKYFKTDFGVRYKIPLVKITSITKYENGLKISFINLKNEPDFEIVGNVEPAGIKMLTSLKTVEYNLETE